MQTPAEKHLIDALIERLGRDGAGSVPRVLNVGAGRSLVIENALADAGVRFRGDRLDVEDCAVSHPSVEASWVGSIERMTPAESERYAVVFANYVLEHVGGLREAAGEVFRALRPDGMFLASVPNPRAPEFVLSRLTPLWFHRWIRRGEAWETEYAYESIRDLTRIFEAAGFVTVEVRRFPFVQGYTHRYPVVGWLGRQYDRVVSLLGVRSLMGNVCVTFRKPGAPSQR